MNISQCYGKELMMRMITFQDFAHSKTNPFFLAYSDINKNTTILINDDDVSADNFYMIIFTACYAYSIFRIFMDLTKILYSYKKIDIIFCDKKNHEIMNETDQKGNKTPRVYEITFYKRIIYFSVWFEFFMSIHNFLIWRGLHYYTSYFMFKENNCIYNIEYINFTSNKEKLWFLQIMIFLWITLDSARMFVTYFSVLTLSRINRKEKSGKKFLRPNLIKSIALSIIY